MWCSGARALHRVKHKSWDNSRNCSSKLGLVKRQIKLCKDNLDLMPSVARAAFFSLETCQNQFSDRRWNCSSIAHVPAMSKDITRGEFITSSSRSLTNF